MQQHCCEITVCNIYQIVGIFYLLNPSDRTMALESAHTLKEMSTMVFSWDVKAARM
jgi:hypothetical protein